MAFSTRRTWLLPVLAGMIGLSGCSDWFSEGASGSGEPGRTLAEIRESGELVVLTRNAPTTRFFDRDGLPSGPEQDLVSAFAEHLGVTVRFKEKPSVAAILEAVDGGGADMGAAGLTATPERRQQFRFGPAYQKVAQQVACRRGNVQPEKPADLVGLDISVIADSSYAERLRHLRRTRLPELAWSTTDSHTTEELLRWVWQGKIDCTVADSNLVAINQRYYPELTVAFNLSEKQDLAWVLPQNASRLDEAIGEWLQQFRASGGLSDLQDHYYGFFREFDYFDIRALVRRIDERLPRYRKIFQKAAKKHDLPFTLLAAQGYQESHWLANARSPTGVRGIMMLTRVTAREVGVSDRLDPHQSIMGGALYMARQKARLADEVAEPDRTRLALAAYNVGWGHLQDAQRLARDRGMNPHRWADLKQVLPLLTKPRYYQQLKYGYARGWEPVRYVQRIREYRHVLDREL